MSEKDSGIHRRAFLQIAGVAGVVAGCSPAAAPQKLVPYLDPPVDQIPGTPVFYRSVCRECSAACGVTARTREGRVVKLEGNPDDPVSGGALCARGQASLQMLYHPERLKGPMKADGKGGFAPVSWDDAFAQIAKALGDAKAKNAGRGVRMLTRTEPGATGLVQKQLFAALDAEPSQRLVLEPLDPWPLRAAVDTLYGKHELPAFDLAAAKSVVSFGADFLESWVSPVELTRAFASGRGRTGEERTRFTWVGPRLSATGVSADRWISIRPGAEAVVALGLVRWLLDPAHHLDSLPADAAKIRALVDAFVPAAVEVYAGITREELDGLGRELVARRPSALLAPGAGSGADAGALSVAVMLANHVLGNTGRTVLLGRDPQTDAPSSPDDVARMIADAAAGAVDVLFLHHADPVGALPAAMGAAAAMAKVPLVVSFNDRLDSSTRKAHLILPDAHALESWDDLPTRPGRLVVQQPAMTPLADTRAAGQTLLDLAAKLDFASGKITATDISDVVQARVESAAKAVPGAPENAARAAIERGGVFAPPPPAQSAPLPQLDRLVPFTLPAEPAALALVAFPTALRADGRTDVPWLQEVADVTSTVAWTPWAEVSPATAAKLGLQTGRKAQLTTAAGSAELPVYVYPSMRDGVIAVPFGARESMTLLPAGGTVAPPVTAKATGPALLPQLEGFPEPHAGALLTQVGGEKPEGLSPIKKLPLYDPPPYKKHRWSMVIDLDKCTGCNACTVACYAENNIPVLGPERIDEGRSMAWIRIDRFFGEEPRPSVDFVPMLCQQCDNAPCEVVCPADATYHTGEGLNAQVYNRCIGTRYCANNCPYKVRVFNWQDPQFSSPLNLGLNPDVNVRSKGVMEKCSFCVQRIRFGENAARDEDRDVRDGDITSACAQTCPAQAITFGDSLDPKSRVSLAAADPRGFRALEDLNTRPAITYLAKQNGAASGKAQEKKG